MALRDRLAEPRLRGLDLDGPDRLRIHRAILEEKAMIRGVFEDLYRECRAVDEARFGAAPGLRVELGAGVSRMNAFYPDVLISDVVPSPHLGLLVDALAMPFTAASVRAIYALNCFHHLSSPRSFFAELVRVLRPAGGCVLIEPYHGRFASWLYPRLFASERFDKTTMPWEQETTAMSAANQALAHNVFVRDRARFESEFPPLEILELRPLVSGPRYLASGGLNFRPLVGGDGGWLRRSERRFGRPHRWLALHQLIAIRKRAA